MGRKLSFLFVILVFSLSGTGQAQTEITVVNPSFELDANGVQTTCSLDIDDGEVLGWTSDGGWAGTSCDINAPGACDDCTWEHTDVTFWPDGGVIAWVYSDVGAHIFQHLDSNDANAVIVAGRRYTLNWCGLAWWSQALDATLFYGGDHDANELATITQDMAQSGETPWDWFYGELRFVAESGQPYLGETLGVKFTGNTPSPSGDYSFMDDVHLTWIWATQAYDPSPENEAELVTRNPTLTWKPGGWAAEHEVYFGTGETAVASADSSDTTGIYKGVQEPNDYTPSGPLVLGQTNYWKITEVNSTPPGGEIPAPPWEGDVWSFRVEGHAYDPSPADEAVDVPFLGLELSWTAGADAESHVVYFGTDAAAVADATTSSPEYETTLSVGTENYAVAGSLAVGRTYYWRIDEKSAGGSHIITGDVWSFRIGEFLVVDNFESYANNGELYEVWDDYWVNGSGGDIFLEKDVNIVRDSDLNPQAVLCCYTNSDKDEGSYFDVQDMTELEIGSDWTVGGVKALQLQMRGDADTELNKQAGEPLWAEGWPWVEIEDTSSNSGYVLYPEEDIIHILSPYWHEWNIDLGIFDACGVDLTAIDRFTIGIGGAKAGQSKANSNTNNMWFDDVRLYPPRCRPELSEAVGDFTGDCSVMYDDLKVMTTDWLLTDGNTPTENRPATLSGFPDETSHWVTGCIGGAVEVNEGYDITITDTRLYGLASMSITAWIKPVVGMERWVGIVSSREYPCDEGGEATELGVYGVDWGGPDGLGYDWSCLSDAWKWDAEVDITDGTWTFVAMSVDPTGCTLYARPEGGALQEGERNIVEHPMQQGFADHFVIGSDDKDGYFVGAIDDVRIYTYALDFNDVNNLAYQTAEPDPPPVYWYKFDETTGYTAADYGTTTEVYMAVPSIANLTDPEPKLQRAVNFADYAILADNWMLEDFWP